MTRSALRNAIGEAFAQLDTPLVAELIDHTLRAYVSLLNQGSCDSGGGVDAAFAGAAGCVEPRQQVRRRWFRSWRFGLCSAQRFRVPGVTLVLAFLAPQVERIVEDHALGELFMVVGKKPRQAQ